MTRSKNILITGASTGIGQSLCKVFIASGYHVFGSVRKESDAESLKAQFPERFEALLFDVVDHDAIDKAAKYLENKIGTEGLCGLINNAGIAIGGPLQHVKIEELRYNLEVNVVGLMKVTQAFLPLLGAKEKPTHEPGKIIQMSSVAGKVAMPFIGPYVASKHALEGLSDSLRRELMLYGIDVIIVEPGPIKTPIWNKGADEERNAPFFNTAYGKSLGIFQKYFVVNAIKKGYDVDYFTEKVIRIFETKNPKARYALVPQKWTNWTLPQMLPTRWLDRAVAKNLKLTKGE